MAKNTIADLEETALSFGIKIIENDEKAKKVVYRIPVSETENVDINVFDANMAYLLEMVAKSAYAKGRLDQKKKTASETKKFIENLTGERTLV